MSLAANLVLLKEVQRTVIAIGRSEGNSTSLDLGIRAPSTATVFRHSFLVIDGFQNRRRRPLGLPHIEKIFPELDQWLSSILLPTWTKYHKQSCHAGEGSQRTKVAMNCLEEM